MKTLIFSFALLACMASVNAQIITTIAGTGTATYSGDGGAATSAALDHPYGVVADAIGNIYLADALNNRIRKISPSGIISTFAGTGVSGSSGDGGPASAAQIFAPLCLVFDHRGNLIFADQDNHKVRKITPAGIISTVAGIGSPGYSGDGGISTAAKLNFPTGVGVDAIGNIYVADQYNNRVRKVDTFGVITTFAGTGLSGFSGDGSAATAAKISAPCGVAADNSGNIYFTDYTNRRIRKVDGAGIITTYAGSTTGYAGDGGPASAALFSSPFGIFIDPMNNMYISDIYNHRIRRISASGMVSTVTGNGTAGASGDGGLATAATTNMPSHLYADCAGNVYFADQFNNKVRQITGHNYVPRVLTEAGVAIVVCKNSGPYSLDGMLSIIDSDALQNITYSLLVSPSHGTAVVSYTGSSTGGVFTPSGLSYTPATGYLGTDSFSVLITDCGGGADTLTIYVSIVNCALSTMPVNEHNTLFAIFPNPVKKTLTITADNQAFGAYRVTNSVGQTVLNDRMTTTITVIDVSILPQGIYYIFLNGVNGEVAGKFIKPE